jgi:hypothetical protein
VENPRNRNNEEGYKTTRKGDIITGEGSRRRRT